MKKIRKLQEALLLADVEDSAVVILDDAWIPSEAYLAGITRMTRKVKNPIWKYVNTVGKKVAVILITLLILFGSMMSVKAIRETVVNFIINIF